MWRRTVLSTVFCCLFFARPCASAEPIVVTASVTLNLLDGDHTTGTEIDRLDFVPLPLAEIDGRRGHAALHVETFPAISFAYGGAVGARQSTRLSIINVIARYAPAGGAFVGVGQTIYNQLTTYPATFANPVVAQSSRVTGVRIEAGITRAAFATSRIEYVFAVNPGMRGIERSAFLARFDVPQSAVPERAAQIDTTLRCVTPLLNGSLVYGLRYLNYAARYDVRSRANGTLADRNAGLLPLVGYQVTL
jgi:hypothetical protein